MSGANSTQFSSVAISKAIDSRADLREKVDQANRELQNLLGASASQASVDWRLTEDANGRVLLLLRLSDFTGYVEAPFDPDEFKNLKVLRFKLHRIWGDLLQARSHKQLEKLKQSAG